MDAAVELTASQQEQKSAAATNREAGKGLLLLTRTVRPLKVMWTQERPTSLPAPSGVMTIWSPSRPPEAGRFPASELLGAATDAIVSPLPLSAGFFSFLFFLPE